MAAPQALRKNGSPKGIRTPVTGLRTRRPRPLDDGTPLSLAGEPGFEPGLPDPESGVLPLHHSPLSNEDSFYRLLRKSQGFAPRLSHRTPASRACVRCRFASERVPGLLPLLPRSRQPPTPRAPGCARGDFPGANAKVATDERQILPPVLDSRFSP